MFNPHLIDDIVGFLELEKPYRITLKPTLKCGSAAEYISLYRRNKLIQHRINIAVDGFCGVNARSLETLIAHEFVHAWQIEYTTEKEHHGEQFIWMAKILEKKFELPRIYIPGLDI